MNNKRRVSMFLSLALSVTTVFGVVPAMGAQEAVCEEPVFEGLLLEETEALQASEETIQSPEAEAEGAVSSDVINKRQSDAEKKAKEIVESVVKTGMAEDEKVIALHDYLIAHCEYYNIDDYEDDPSNPYRKWVIDTDPDYDPLYQSAYGALIEERAIEEGYTRGFKLLLDTAGIENAIAESDLYAYEWNKIKLGDYWYNTDSSLNDRLGGGVNSRNTIRYRGRINRDYLLLSDNMMNERFKLTFQGANLQAAIDNHTTDDGKDCTDTTYDKAVWRNIHTPLVYLGDYVYYGMPYQSDETQVEGIVRIAKSAVTGDSSAVTPEWVFVFDELLKQYYSSGLFEYGDMLYFNNESYILKIDPTTAAGTTMAEPAGVFKKEDGAAAIRYVFFEDSKAFYSDANDDIHEFDPAGSVKYVKSGIQSEGEEAESEAAPATSSGLIVFADNTIRMMKGTQISVTKFPGAVSGNYVADSVSVNDVDKKFIAWNAKKGILKFKKIGETKLTVAGVTYTVKIVKPALKLKKDTLTLSGNECEYLLDIQDCDLSYGTIKFEGIKFSKVDSDAVIKKSVSGGAHIEDIDMQAGAKKGYVKFNAMLYYINPAKDRDNSYNPVNGFNKKMEKKMKIGSFKLTVLPGVQAAALNPANPIPVPDPNPLPVVPSDL